MPKNATHLAEAPESRAISETVDLYAYWRTVARRRWLVIPFFIATVAVTAIVTLHQTKIYDSTVTLVIDLSAPRVLDKDVEDVVETGTGSYWYSREYFETQYKIIASRAVAQRVLDRLQLQANDKFNDVASISDPAEREQARRLADPLTRLKKNLSVEPVKDSRIVRIRYEDPDPVLASLIANAFADAYIEESLSVITSTTRSASEWLEQQLAELEKKLDQSGQSLFGFKQKHDIVATSWEDRQSMVSQRLTAVNDALTKARVRRAELEAREESIRASAGQLEQGRDDFDSLPVVAANPVIQQLKVRFFDARSECADLRVKYLDDHPKLEECQKKLDAARTALQEEIRSSLEAARREYEEVNTTERNLSLLLSNTKSEAFALNQHEREYLELKRTDDNNKRLYEEVLKRLKDTGVTGMLQMSNVRVLDRASPADKPVRPNVLRNIILAIITGLLGGVGLAFLAELLDTSLTSQQEIEEKLGVAFLGIIPSIKPNKDGTPQDLAVYTQPKSAVAECVRAVRTNLLFMSPEKPLRTILMTSSGPQEGKTTVATSLAITMTSSGQRVLLVDADMRRPRLHRIFGLENSAGLSSLILGEGTLGELARNTPIPGLWVLTCGPVPPNPAELLHTATFRAVVKEMSERFDRVIFDSPPVGVVADAVVASTQVDGTVLILKAGRTTRDAARQTVRQLNDVNANIFGGVLNDLDLDDQKYGQYSYYYRYGYYYGDRKPSGNDDKLTAT